MRIRLQPWQLAVSLVLLSSAFVGLVRWRQNRVRWGAEQMIAALPIDRATVLYADVATLRKAGIVDLLAGSKSAEDADYRNFVAQIGFDYRTDLDAVAAAFVNGESFYTVRGRFQWKQLAEYARTQGGECHYTTCSLPANEPGRKISFYPLRSDILALAVTSEHSGVEMIAPSSAKISGQVATDPVWVTIPASALTKPGALPPGLQVLLGGEPHSRRGSARGAPAVAAFGGLQDGARRASGQRGILVRDECSS